MPLGIIVKKWNERIGLETLAQYPRNKDFFISNQTFLHLLNLHGFSNESGMTSLTVKETNIITYYSGSDTGYFVILALNLLENAEDFEEKLEEIALEILDNLKDNQYEKLLPRLYRKILQPLNE
ncbi:MAG: hypothetical protein JW891_08940 [Candidatus Lokiarchaeota archaeon]|nr:hypothetical protein [Candidatus Lokiarchaeota archaeon]